MKTSEVLNTAADLIEQRGWTIGGGWPGSPTSTHPLCLEGGIMAALGIDMPSASMPEFASCPSYLAVQRHLGFEPGLNAPGTAPLNPLYHFNDDIGRTAAEVIEVLRAAAGIEQTRESEAAEVVA